MRAPSPIPSHGSTPPMPDTTAHYEAIVKGLYTPPSIPQGHNPFGHPISLPPQETVSRRQGGKDILGRRSGVARLEGDGWIYAPATSHISRFAFSESTDKISQLTVIFKGPNEEGESAEYAYYFTDHGTGLDVYNEMRSSGHPYGDILYPKVIQAGIPYRPISRS